MNRRLMIVAASFLAALLSGCSVAVDERPAAIRESEKYLARGVAAYRESDYVAATGFFNKALANYRSLDDSRGTLISHLNLAETALATGSYQALDTHADAARRISEREGYTEFSVRITLLRAAARLRQRDYEEALNMVAPLLPRFSEKDVPAVSPTPVEIAAIVLRTKLAFANDGANAGEWTDRLRNSLSGAGTSSQNEARLKRFEAALAVRQERFSDAARLYEQALAIYHETLHRPGIAATLGEWARSDMAQNKWHEARDKLTRALFIRIWMLDRTGTAETLDLLATAHSRLEDNEAADTCARWASAFKGPEAVDWELLKANFQPL